MTLQSFAFVDQKFFRQNEIGSWEFTSRTTWQRWENILRYYSYREDILEPNALKSSWNREVGKGEYQIRRTREVKCRLWALNKSCLLPSRATDLSGVHLPHLAHSNDANRCCLHYHCVLHTMMKVLPINVLWKSHRTGTDPPQPTTRDYAKIENP